MTFSGSRLCFPPHRCYHTTYNDLTKPRKPVLPCQPTSLAAAAAQRHHPRPSLAVLAIGTVSVPVRGLAHRFQSLELDRPQISKKPSVTKSSLLQLHFKTHHGISHRPWLRKRELARAFWTEGVDLSQATLEGTPPTLTLSRNKGATSFTSDILKQTPSCTLSGGIHHSRC